MKKDNVTKATERLLESRKVDELKETIKALKAQNKDLTRQIEKLDDKTTENCKLKKRIKALDEANKKLTDSNKFVRERNRQLRGVCARGADSVQITTDTKKRVINELINGGVISTPDEFDSLCNSEGITPDEFGKYNRSSLGLQNRVVALNIFKRNAYYIARGIAARGEEFKPISQLMNEYYGFMASTEQFFIDLLSEELKKQQDNNQ